MCFHTCDVPTQSELPRGVVDSDEALPLLDGEGLVFWYAQSDHLTLCIESIEVYMCDDAQCACCRVIAKLYEVLERKLGFAAPSGYGEG